MSTSPRGMPAPAQAEKIPKGFPSMEMLSISTTNNVSRSPPQHRSIDQALDTMSFGWGQQRILLLIMLATSCDAMEVTLLSFLQECSAQEWDLAPGVESLLTSSVFIGQILGLVLMGPTADKFGRRRVVLFGWSIIILFGVLSAFSFNIWQLIAARALVGFGIGSSQTVAYDIIAELLPSKHRGRLLVYCSFAFTLGELFVAGVAWAALDLYGWRSLALFAAIPMTLVLLLSHWILPESPRWLCSHGKVTEAEMILQMIAALNGNSNNGTDNGGPVILTETPTGSLEEGSFLELVGSTLWPVTKFIWIIWISFGFSYFGQSLSIAKHFERLSPINLERCSFQYPLIFLVDAAELVGTVVAILLVDTSGRSLAQAKLYIAAAAFSTLFAISIPFASQTTVTLFIMAAKASLIGATSITWAHTSEIYPTELRATGHSLANICGKMGAFASILWVNYMPSVELMCSGIAAMCLSAGTAALFLPEIHGHTLDVLSRRSTLKMNKSLDENEEEEMLLTHQNAGGNGRNYR